ncbi:GHKL domain-containing protein [Leptobacterium flavescens]|uniref:histidine kinase n=1 Tax=Leptobacterium flavescens TaxID=472055 RepID=A0A6P0ULM6_9FLAO|nr:HAMP domain-containing sensor histidine kinase [Leptobacterium flavescens]NER12818.1 GHKL domain-containing protein [Leptobacterium flavescens]
MQLSKTSITIVIAVTLMSLIGLVAIQVHWLNKSVETNRQIFRQKMDLATNMAGEMFRKNGNAPYELHQAIISGATDKKTIDRIVSEAIDSSFIQCNIPLTYTYGVYEHTDHDGNRLLAGNTDEVLLNNSVCNANDGREFGWTRLTCSMGYGNDNNYHLAIFPSFSAFIFNEVKGTLITSVIFILLILAGFFYTIITIKRQKRLSEIKNDFINNLTHEFKTPIFSIGLASSALRKTVNTDEKEKVESYLDVIDHEGERLKNQVDKILQLSLLNSRKFTLEKKKINLRPIIENVIESFEMLIRQKNGVIKFKSNIDNIYVQGDEVHLTNAIYNLIDNAIKYTDKSPEIDVTAHLTPDNIAIAVKDNGLGIKKEKQKSIFDKFYRISTGNIHNVKGFGIGLSYVKEIIEAHQGIISLESKWGEGSTFTVNLPAL